MMSGRFNRSQSENPAMESLMLVMYTETDEFNWQDVPVVSLTRMTNCGTADTSDGKNAEKHTIATTVPSSAPKRRVGEPNGMSASLIDVLILIP